MTLQTIFRASAQVQFPYAIECLAVLLRVGLALIIAALLAHLQSHLVAASGADVMRSSLTVVDNEYFPAPGNSELRHNVSDLDVAIGGRSVRADFLTHFHRTGGIERWGYPTSEVLVIEQNALTQFYQRGVVDFHDVGAGWVVERRLAWDYIGGGNGGSPDLGVEPGVLNPHPGVVSGPWGHKVSNIAVDGTETGFADFYARLGGEAAFGFPKTDARADSNLPGTLHVDQFAPGIIRQYFQAAVLELHPNDPVAPVKLALLGDQLRQLLVPDWQDDPAFRAALRLSIGSVFIPPVAAAESIARSADGGFAFSQLSAGHIHTCALKSDGRILCWGSNSYFSDSDRGVAMAPPGRYKAVAAGGSHSCAIKLDSSALCWGSDSYEPPGQFTTLTSGGGLVTGAGHTCGIRLDGTLECWGSGGFGQTKAPSGSFNSASAGASHTCGIRADSTITCWGRDEYGQSSPPAGSFRAVSAGWNHSCGITDRGAIECWGANGYGQSSPPAGAYTAVSTGRYHACAIGQEGQIDCWGNDEWGQSSPPGGEFLAVSAGTRHACGLRDDATVTCWGSNLDPNDRRILGQAAPPSHPFVQIDTGWRHVCGTTVRGEIFCWGEDTDDQIAPAPGRYKMVSAGGGHTCGITVEGEVVCWGDNSIGQSTPPPGKFTFLSTGSGGGHTCGITVGNDVVCWGYDEHGEATPPPGKFTHVSASVFHSCGVRVNGEVACWGLDDYGQSSPPAGRFLSVSTSQQRSCGVTVGGGIECWGGEFPLRDSELPTGPFKSVSLAFHDVCALESDGQVACTSSPGPDGERRFDERVPDLPPRSFTEISASNEFVCGLRIDGAPLCWRGITLTGGFDSRYSFPDSPLFSTIRRDSFHNPLPTGAAAVDRSNQVDDCFGGVLSADPVHCAVLQYGHNQGFFEMAAIFREGNALAVFLKQARHPSAADFEAMRAKARSEIEEHKPDGCYLGVGEDYDCPGGAYFDGLGGAALPKSPNFSAIRWHVGGPGQLTNQRGWASFEQLWPAPSQPSATGPMVPASAIDISDVHADGFPIVDCSNRSVLFTLDHGYVFGGIDCDWWKQNPERQFVYCWRQSYDRREPGDGDCQDWLRHPDLGVAAFLRHRSGAYWQVKAPGGDPAVLERTRDFLLNHWLYDYGSEDLVLIGVDHDYGDLWRWQEVLDRFAYSAGNSIGIVRAYLVSNDEYSGADWPIFTAQGPGRSNRDTPIDTRKTIFVSTLDIEATRAALPQLLPRLGIPVEAVGIIG